MGLSVRNYHYSLRNNAEERGSHLLRGGSLKSRKFRSSLIWRGYITRSFLIYEFLRINYEAVWMLQYLTAARVINSYIEHSRKPVTLWSLSHSCRSFSGILCSIFPEDGSSLYPRNFGDLSLNRAPHFRAMKLSVCTTWQRVAVWKYGHIHGQIKH
jgi:hypothetical protein